MLSQDSFNLHFFLCVRLNIFPMIRAICIFFSVNTLFKFFAHFFLLGCILLLLIFRNSLYIMENSLVMRVAIVFLSFSFVS